MKILFLIGSNPVDAVSTWDEIKIYKDKGHITPSKDYYSIFKTMEQNNEIEQEILSARHTIGIPEAGISWNDYYDNYYLKSLSTYEEQESKNLQEFFSKVKNEAKRINKNLKPNTYVSGQLENLIIGSFVNPADIPISLDAIQADELNPALGNTEVLIRISHLISQNELVTFIEDNYLRIHKLMKLLPQEPKLTISKRDLQIVELRDKEKMKFGAIASKLQKEYGTSEKTLGEDSVKTAYRRAKKKIKNTTQTS